MSARTLGCDDAIAYLKPRVEDATGRVVSLEHDDSPVLRDLGNGLLVSYVVDHLDHFEYINHQQLAAQGFSEDELHQLALSNLASAVAGLVQVQRCDAIFAVIAGGNFEASLILLDHLWDHAFRQFVDAPHAVAIPARDILAFTDATDEAACAQLQDVIARVWPSGDHLLVDRPFTRTDGVWAPQRTLVKRPSGRPTTYKS